MLLALPTMWYSVAAEPTSPTAGWPSKPTRNRAFSAGKERLCQGMQRKGVSMSRWNDRAVAGAVGVLMSLCACPALADDVADFYKGKTLTIVVGPRSANRLRHLRPYSCPSSRTSYPWQTIGCSAPADLHW